jgi:type I restriction-modification system DNA methylase subunit
MALYQKSVLKKYLNQLETSKIEKAYKKYANHFLNPIIQENIRNSKEEQYQEGFLRDLFVKILGYTLNPDPDFNLTTEYKNVKDSKKADGAILIDNKVRAVIELKGTNTTDLGKIETQAFGYKNNQPDCNYIITSNFEKIRFYIDNAIEHVEFNLFTLTEADFELLYLLLAFENLSNGLAKRIKDESINQENVITKKLYQDYSIFKRELHQNLVLQNPNYEPLELFKKSQKLIDRFLFLFFAEDRQLLPPNSVRLILNDWRDLQERDVEIPLYDRFKKYFGYLNTGYKGKRYDVYAYNGGLFKPDEVLDSVTINDELLYKHALQLSAFDFASEVDVNILGHIFENSLNELDELKAELEGVEIDKSKTKRKKDGVFYTPKYITKYIVDNTVGTLCNEKKGALQLVEEDYIIDKKRQKKTMQALVEKLNEYRKWLLQLTICDPACGSGAFLNQALDFLITEHKYIDELQAKLFGDAMVMSDVEKSILENNLFGVDLNEESVEIAKLSLWLRTAQPNRKLNDLNNNIKCGNSLIDDVAIAGEKAFNWQTAFPQVFANGGFDVVIGNPPYVQIQSLGSTSNDLEKRKFYTFEKTGDLYCLFYELGNIILKENGILGYITSNKWLRANYGKSLRNYLLKNTQPLELLDLGSGIFESATVDSNILIFKKTLQNTEPFVGLNIANERTFTDFTAFEIKKVQLNPKIDEIWAISNPLESQIRQKILQIGTSLKDWDIIINRGILTGLNEAYIINEETKNKLINEDSKNTEIIRPLLRGRDVNRYKIDYSNLFLINCHNGYKDNPRIVIDDYPFVKQHLQQFEPQLSKRGDKGATPFNLRNCAYVEDFYKEKIIWKEMSSETPFTIDNNYFFANDTITFITGENLKFLLVLLNSKITLYMYSKYYAGGGLGSTGIRFKKEFLSNLPIKKISLIDQQPFVEKADLMLSLNKELQEQSQKFQRTLQRKFELETLPKKLQDWYLLPYPEFIKELIKQKVKLTLSQEAEWEDYFTTEAKKVLALKTEIDATDKAIDAMVYELYGLSKEEIKIVENN